MRIRELMQWAGESWLMPNMSIWILEFVGKINPAISWSSRIQSRAPSRVIRNHTWEEADCQSVHQPARQSEVLRCTHVPWVPFLFFCISVWVSYSLTLRRMKDVVCNPEKLNDFLRSSPKLAPTHADTYRVCRICISVRLICIHK